MCYWVFQNDCLVVNSKYLILVLEAEGVKRIFRLSFDLVVGWHEAGPKVGNVGLAGIAKGCYVKIFYLFLLFHMHFNLFEIFFADSIGLKSNLDFDSSMGCYHPVGGNVAESRTGVQVIYSCPYFLEDKVDLKVANVLDLNSLLGILVEEHSSHRYKSILWLNYHLWTNSLSFEQAANWVLIRIKLETLLEALLLYGLELNHSLERSSLSDFLQTIQHIEWTKYWHVLLLELGCLSLICYHQVPHCPWADSNLSKVDFSMVDGEHLSDWSCGYF